MNTVIFDMDGLLIDSEPIWYEATNEIFATKDFYINDEQYATSTGLRTAEFLEHWFNYFDIDKKLLQPWEEWLFELVIDKVSTKGKAMEGVEYIINFFLERNFKLGLASSSPMSLIDSVVDKLKIRKYLLAITSAQHLPYGKPNPQVYLDCAKQLNSREYECICFEDSINGMIAAKAAKMKCVVVPAIHQNTDKRWALADYVLNNLGEFNESIFDKIKYSAY